MWDHETLRTDTLQPVHYRPSARNLVEMTCNRNDCLLIATCTSQLFDPYDTSNDSAERPYARRQITGPVELSGSTGCACRFATFLAIEHGPQNELCVCHLRFQLHVPIPLLHRWSQRVLAANQRRLSQDCCMAICSQPNRSSLATS